MEKFYNLSEDTIDDFNSIFSKKSFPVNVKFDFIGSSKQKKLISISKIPDQFAFKLDKELMVTINEDLLNSFDEESVQILFEQEIDRISIKLDTGAIKLIKPDLTTFSSLVNKYGIEKISRANQIELLAVDQKEDAESEFEI